MSEERHPNCVTVLPEFAAAQAVADWLTGKGYSALAVPPSAVATPGDSLGLSPEVFPGVEVRVARPEHADPARALLADQREAVAAARTREEARAARTGTTTAVCEECGKPSDWPASAAGTTQDCPHCGGYMDVPDPDEDWEGVDFSAGGEDTEGEERPGGGEKA